MAKISKSERKENLAELTAKMRADFKRICQENGFRLVVNICDSNGIPSTEHWMIRTGRNRAYCNYWPATKHLMFVKTLEHVYFQDHLEAARYAIDHAPKPFQYHAQVDLDPITAEFLSISAWF